jgi:hypothetical protein
LIRERTGEGRKRAKAAGVKFGRKPKLSPFQRAEAIRRRSAGERLADIAKSYAVDISMISRLRVSALVIVLEPTPQVTTDSGDIGGQGRVQRCDLGEQLLPTT